MKILSNGYLETSDLHFIRTNNITYLTYGLHSQVVNHSNKQLKQQLLLLCSADSSRLLFKLELAEGNASSIMK